MIILVGIRPTAPRPGVRLLSTLPPPSDRRFTGAILACRGRDGLRRTVRWVRDVRAERRHLPLGIVAAIEEPALRDLLMEALKVELIEPTEVAGGVPRKLVDGLIDRTVVPRILEQWEDALGQPPTELAPVLLTIASAGASARSLPAALRESGWSRSTAYRMLDHARMPSPGVLWRHARVAAVDTRVANGEARHDALRASGWSSPKDFQRARARLAASPPPFLHCTHSGASA